MGGRGLVKGRTNREMDRRRKGEMEREERGEEGRKVTVSAYA